MIHTRPRRFALVAITLSAVAALPAAGQVINEDAKLLPGDGAAEDFFGISIALSGDVAVVGAYGDDDDGTDSGSAYLFDTTTGEQIAKLLPNDGAAHDWFGLNVAISGDTAIVGAYGDGDNGTNSGSAYLFDTITGEQIAKLLPNDGAASDLFGSSIAISGDTAIVGAYLDDDNGTDSGSAYVFDLNCGPILTALGTCPGPMRFKVEDVTANERVAYLYAHGTGAQRIPNGNPCAGTQLGLNATVQLAGVERADANGVATLDVNVPNAACGRIYVQAIDLGSCATTNVVSVD